MDTLELVEQMVDDVAEFKKNYKQKLEEIKEIAEKGSNPALLNQIMEDLEAIKATKGHKYSIEKDAAIPTTQSLIKEALAGEFEKIKAQANEPRAKHEFKVKNVGNMTASANLTGNVVAAYAAQPAVRGRRKLFVRDLVNVIPSATGSWKFYRQNTPVGEGSFDTQSTHGGLKNQVDYDLTEVTVTVDYIAGYSRIAKQMLTDLPFMQAFLSNELVEDYLRTESNKFFMQIAGSATGGDVSSITSTVTVEKIIDAIANMEENDYEVNGIVVTNSVWAKLLKTKPNDYSIPGGVTITSDGNVAIAGVPVYKTNAYNIGANRVLLGDWTKAAIIQTEGLNVNMYNQDQDNAIRNLVTTVAEARVALAILRPDAFCYMGAGLT